MTEALLARTPGVARSEKLEWLLWAADATSSVCFPWLWSVDTHGYGRVQWEGRIRSVNHVILELAGRPRPSRDHQSLHRCPHGDLRVCGNQSHLRWGTSAENMTDKADDGYMRGRYQGALNPAARLTPDNVRAIRKATGATNPELASRFGVSVAAISKVRTHRTWTHLDPS